MTFLSHFVSKMHVSKKYGLHHCSQAMARGRECKKKTLRGCGMQLLDPFLGCFLALWSFLAFLLGKRGIRIVQPLRALLIPLHGCAHAPACPCSHACARTSGDAHGCAVLLCVHRGCRHAQGGAPSPAPPRPEPRGRKPAILCGRSPCRYNAREGIMPGLTF